MPTCGRQLGLSGTSRGHLSRLGRLTRRTAKRRRTEMPGESGFSGGAAYRNRTDDLRITRGMLPCIDGMTCTDSTPDSTSSADCTRISRPPVPRPVPRPSRRPSLATQQHQRELLPGVRRSQGCDLACRHPCADEDCAPFGQRSLGMSHTTSVSPVSDGLRSPRWPRQTCGMESSRAFCVSPVSACPATSRAQMRAQIGFLVCWFVSTSMTARSGTQRAHGSI